ncbi:hypothetical protein JCM8202_001421 [Rhodotorula sphaerocarpa]
MNFDDAHLRQYAAVRAQSDTKPLKKAMRDFYALLADDARGDKLIAAHAVLTIGLDQLEHQLGKTRRIDLASQTEIAQYRAQVAQLEHTSEETRHRLVALRQRLEAAQQERARRIEYDAIAKTISQLPDRQKGQESLDKLNEDIERLRQEERTYAETWQARKVAFDGIVSNLETMQEAIRDEKAEQERRRALDAEEEEDDASRAAGAAGAKLGGGSSTNGASTPAAVEAEAEMGEDAGTEARGPGGGSLDPNARPFVPPSSTTTPGGDTAGRTGEGERGHAGEEEEDVEMRDEEDRPEAGKEERSGRAGPSGSTGEGEPVQMTDGGGEREEGEM